MKTITKLSILLLSSLSFIPSAYANSPYVLGQLGIIDVDDRDDWEKFKFTGRIALGYEWDNSLIFGSVQDPRYLCFSYGVELGYHYYPKMTNSDQWDYGYSYTSWDASYRRNTIDLLATLSINPTKRVEIFAKVGPALVMQKYNYSYSTKDYWNDSIYGSHYHSKYNRFTTKLIAGLGYDITRKININLAYMHEFETSSVGEAHGVTAGFKFNFA